MTLQYIHLINLCTTIYKNINKNHIEYITMNDDNDDEFIYYNKKK